MFLNLNKSSRRILLLFLIALLFFSFPLSANADRAIVKNIRYWSSPDYTRVVIDLTNSVEFFRNRLSNPDRIYFDLKNTSIEKEIKTILTVGDGVLKKVRASQFDNETVRVVLDIEEISDFKTFMIDDPVRLVVDLHGKTKDTDKPAASITRRRIVIDPGHGGHDPGAVGPNNLYEKDVVLDIALKLKKILAEDPLNEVFLTREKDVFIPLEERTAIANRKSADLFVSVHANASVTRRARGIETYLLNWTDDEEAIKVAARENKISLKKMKALNRQMDIVEVIKSDLSRSHKRDESVNLANYVQRSLITNLEVNYGHVLNLGVKQALFYVLFGAKMPSVLVEVSFISNPEEERLLSRDAYREDIARAIADGLNSYMSSAPVIQRFAEFKGSEILFR